MPHPQSSVDAARDIAAMELELAFADAAFIEKRLERIEASMRSVKMGERDVAERETALLQRLKAGLEADKPLRAQEISDEEAKMLVNYQFLTDKPLLVVLNIADDDAARAAEIEAEVRARSSKRRRRPPSPPSAARSSRSSRRCRTTTPPSSATISASPSPASTA